MVDSKQGKGAATSPAKGKGKGKGKASLLALAVAKAKGKGKGKNIEETAASQKLADVPEDQENQDKKTPPKLRKKKSIKPKDVQTKEMEPKDTGKALEGRKRLRRSKTPREMKEEVAEDEQQEPEETEETEESNEHQEQKAKKRKKMAGMVDVAAGMVRLRTKTSVDSLSEGNYVTPQKRKQVPTPSSQGSGSGGSGSGGTTASSERLHRSFSAVSDGNGSEVEVGALIKPALDGRTCRVQNLNDNQKVKIRELSQSDIPIQQRRALYNQMARRMKGPNLKPGLVEKYTSASSSRKERFQLLKEFLVDENMSEVCVEAYFVQEAEKKSTDVYEKVAWFELEEQYSKTESGRAYLERLKNSQAGEANPQFPDDERFKLFKVYRKNKTTSGDVTRAGSKTSATAVCTGTAKAALGEMLDSQVAELKQSAGNTKQPKNPKTNRSPKEEAAKALQKDINALRDKGQKARELASEMNMLEVPHQEALLASLKSHHKLFRDISEKMEDAVFQKKSIEEVYELKNAKQTQLEAAMEDLDNASSTVRSWKSRIQRKEKAQEKAKEKEKAKAKVKASKRKTPEEPANEVNEEWDEDWGEEWDGDEWQNEYDDDEQ